MNVVAAARKDLPLIIRLLKPQQTTDGQRNDYVTHALLCALERFKSNLAETEPRRLRAPNYQVSERWACRLLGQCRGTQRYRPTPSVAEDALTAAIVALASHYGRDGYRRVTALLNRPGSCRTEGDSEISSSDAVLSVFSGGTNN